jgi:hypothetical protein
MVSLANHLLACECEPYRSSPRPDWHSRNALVAPASAPLRLRARFVAFTRRAYSRTARYSAIANPGYAASHWAATIGVTAALRGPSVRTARPWKKASG